MGYLEVLFVNEVQVMIIEIKICLLYYQIIDGLYYVSCVKVVWN